MQKLSVIAHYMATLQLNTKKPYKFFNVTLGCNNIQGASVIIHVTDEITAEITRLFYL